MCACGGPPQVGGAVATAVAHLGRSFAADHVQRVQCLLPNASLVTVDRADPEFGLVVGAVGHSGCLIVEVHIEALPRRRWSWTTAHYDYDAAVLTDWIHNRSTSSILWIRPVAKRATLHTAAVGTVDLPASATRAPVGPLMARPHFATPSLSYDVYGQLLALALALAWPLVRQVARDVSQVGAEAFIDEYVEAELSRPDLPPTTVKDDRGSTQFATLELEVLQHTDSLPGCVQAWVGALDVADAPLHLRWAPSSTTDAEPERSAFASRPDLPLAASGDALVKLDVSLPLPLLQRVDLASVQHACPTPVDNPPNHAGKLTLAEVAERRLWRRPPVAAHAPPGRDDAAFQALRAAWDPTGKFGPRVE